MKIFSLVTILGLFISASSAYAVSPPVDQNITESLQSFQKVITVPPVSVLVPTVVEIPLNDQIFKQENFLVRDTSTGTYLNSYLKQDPNKYSNLSVVSTFPVVQSSVNLSDNNTNTYTEFPVPDVGQGSSVITVVSDRPITTSQLNVNFAQYVALPLTVELKAGLFESRNMKTIVATKRMTATNVTFPEVTANIFEITFTYAQPLRVSELSFLERNAIQGDVALRFLAQPGNSYLVYYQSDRPVFVSKSESGNLSKDEGVLVLPEYNFSLNPLYLPADTDKDGIVDLLDNCVHFENQDQLDIDKNGKGDVCDDFDRDGVVNVNDNCINLPNRNQLDTDGDKIGDVCDDEESRFTEKNPWIPWVGMGTAAGVLVILFMLVAKGTKLDEVVEVQNKKIEEESE